MILIIGCFDTKGEEFEFLIDCLDNSNQQLVTINIGSRPTNVSFSIDYSPEEVASFSTMSFDEMISLEDRGQFVEQMGEACSLLIKRLSTDHEISAAIGMGGGGGTYMFLRAIQPLPFGVPKVCMSTVATKDLSRQVGAKDVVLIPSIVDITGLNSISRAMIQQSAAALLGLIRSERKSKENNTVTIGLSAFGNTTECVNTCTSLLEKEGFEVLTFHAVGSGGATFESLIREGIIDAVIDVTTTELADELCSGICSAGPDRLTAASEMGIPQLVVPGCLDMVNFGPMDTVPDKYRNRLLYSWAPDVTLMRTNAEENRVLGEEIAEKINNASGNTSVFIPRKAISIISQKEGVFYQPEVDELLFSTIEANLNSSIPCTSLDLEINDPEFAKALVDQLLTYLREPKA